MRSSKTLILMCWKSHGKHSPMLRNELHQRAIQPPGYLKVQSHIQQYYSCPNEKVHQEKIK